MIRLPSRENTWTRVRPIGNSIHEGKQAQGEPHPLPIRTNVCDRESNVHPLRLSAWLQIQPSYLLQSNATVSCLDNWPEDTLKLSVDVHRQWPRVPANPCGKGQQRERRRVTFPLEGSSGDGHQSTSDNEPSRDSRLTSMSKGKGRAEPRSEDSSTVVSRNASWAEPLVESDETPAVCPVLGNAALRADLTEFWF